MRTHHTVFHSDCAILMLTSVQSLPSLSPVFRPPQCACGSVWSCPTGPLGSVYFLFCSSDLIIFIVLSSSSSILSSACSDVQFNVKWGWVAGPAAKSSNWLKLTALYCPSLPCKLQAFNRLQSSKIVTSVRHILTVQLLSGLQKKLLLFLLSRHPRILFVL